MVLTFSCEMIVEIYSDCVIRSRIFACGRLSKYNSWHCVGSGCNRVCRVNVASKLKPACRSVGRWHCSKADLSILLTLLLHKSKYVHGAHYLFKSLLRLICNNFIFFLLYPHVQCRENWKNMR